MANKLVPIYLLNSSFQVQAVFDDYESAYYARTLYTPGKFEIRINYNKPNVSLFARDLFVLFAGDNRRLGIINSVKKNLGKSGKIAQVVTVSGYELRNVFERRIVVPPVGQESYAATGVAETIFKNFLANQCIGSGTASRNFTFLTLAADSARGSNCEISARLKNVGATLWDLATMVDMGISITAPSSGSVATVDVIPGVDRRSSQSTNPRAIFSVSSDTAGDATILDSDAKYKNLVYAAGQGVGTARNILTVYSGGEPTGLFRREMYLDARDLESNTDITTRANNKLAEYGQTITLDAEALQYSALQLGTDYDLGDLCTCEALGVTSDVRITEVQESWASNKYEINLTFGKPVASITNQVATIYNTNQTINNFSEFGQNAAETLITTNAPKYLGRYLASNPASYNNGDSWVVYDADDSPIQRGLWYSNNGTPTRITTSSSMELQGKFIPALGDIAWAEENGYGIASDYGFSAIFQSLGVVTAFVNSLFAQYIKVQTGGSIRGGDRYDETGAIVDGTKPGFFIAASGACKVAGIDFSGSLSGGVQWGAVSTSGNYLSRIDINGVCKLGNNSVVLSVGTSAGFVAVYLWTGTGFVRIGNQFSISGGIGAIARLSSSSFAGFQTGVSELKAYAFNGTNISQIGSTYTLGNGATAVASLGPNKIAVITQSVLARYIQIYSWNGSVFSPVGNQFTIASAYNFTSISALSATRIAIAYQSSTSPVTSVIKCCDFDGTNWANVGNSFTISEMGNPKIAALNGSDIILRGEYFDGYAIYRFDETNFALVGGEIRPTASLVSSYPMCALTGSDIAYATSTGLYLATISYSLSDVFQ